MKQTCLYETDETAWLEQMSKLISERRYGELDYEHLSEYLLDMAKRDRREVLHRLTTLLAHLVKWGHQPARDPEAGKRRSSHNGVNCTICSTVGPSRITRSRSYRKRTPERLWTRSRRPVWPSGGSLRSAPTRWRSCSPKCDSFRGNQGPSDEYHERIQAERGDLRDRPATL